MPSFAEGFGLPIIEALALGTPVIASDLAAHREVGKELVVYRKPTDEVGWQRDIERFVFTNDAEAIRQRIAAEHCPVSSQGYFAEITRFFESIVAG